MKLRVTTVIISIFTLLFTACEIKIPINEIIKAKVAIDRAMSVNAEKYSPDEMKVANDEMVKAHSLIINDEKPEDSVKNAETAYNKAVEAYNRSAVLYAADALKKADEAIAAADVAYAEKLSAENYTQARDFYNAGNEKFENKDYIAAYSLADEAYKKAVKAKEDSIDNKDQLRVKIDEVNSTLSRVAKYSYKDFAEQKYNVAKEKANKASEDYNNDLVKSGFESVEIAKINADEAYKLTMNGTAEKKIAEAEKSVREAAKSEGAGYAGEDMAAAKEALENAKKMKNSGNYNESITYSNEAIRLSNSVISEGQKAVVAAKVKMKAEKEAQEKAAKEKAEAEKEAKRVAAEREAAEKEAKEKEKADKLAAENEAAEKAAAEKAEKEKALAEKKKAKAIEEDENYYYYKVKSWSKNEECLSKIAEKYYKNAKAWHRIHKANKDLIKNPDLIQPRWIIKVPKIKK